MTAQEQRTPGLERLIARAQTLTEPVADLASTLRTILSEEGNIHTFPAGAPPLQHDKVAFTDGAVASEQTDALTWVAATGVCQMPGDDATQITAHAVAPVCPDTERLRAALMATSEVAATTSTFTTHRPDVVMMDGGIATPLVSIAQGHLVRDPDVAAEVAEFYTASDMATHISRYIDHAVSGRVAALPKQDTATAYLAQWAHQHAQRLTGPAQAAMGRMRDRPVLGAVLEPGEWVTPRRATSLANVEAKVWNDTDGWVPLPIDRDFGRLRACTNLYVTYFRPHRLASRVIKVEFYEADPQRWTTARALIQYLDAVTVGPRVKEPLGQHLVDAAAKRAVTSAMTEMLGAASMAMATIDRYRTVR